MIRMKYRYRYVIVDVCRVRGRENCGEVKTPVVVRGPDSEVRRRREVRRPSGLLRGELERSKHLEIGGPKPDGM